MAAPERIGPYAILGELGSGGMGIVYRARREDIGRDVALKVLRPELRSDPQVVARFKREAAAASAVAGHPGLVAVHDAGVDGDLAWCAMEFIEGRGLDELIDEGDLAPADAARIMEQVARALEHIHGLGILHRDLKPANVLIARGSGEEPAAPRALLTDFGLASVRPAGPEVTRLTHSNLLIGTPSYMPPEQVTGEAAEPTADVYAAGATLYHALCGRPPHDEPTIAATLESVLHGTIPLPSRLAPAIPAPLERIVMQCLARNPADRYPTAIALAEDLARHLRGEPVLAAGRTALGHAAERSKAPLAVAAVVVLAGAATAGLWKWSGESTQTAARAEQEASVAGREAELDAAFAALQLQTRRQMRRLEDHFHGLTLDSAGRAAALAAIATAAEEVRRSHAGTTLPDAWHGLARCFAGETAQGRAVLDAACDAATDPFPLLLRARLHLAVFVREIHVPSAWIIDGVPELVPEPETTAMADARLAAANDLERATSMPIAARLARGREYQAFHDGVRAWIDGDHLLAIARFETVAENTPLEQEARAMLGHLLYREQRFREAALLFDRAAERGWLRPLTHAASARLSHAHTLTHDAAAQRDMLLEAREAYRRLLQAYPGDVPGTIGLAEATLFLAQHYVQSGQDAEPLLHAVINDCTHVRAAGMQQLRAVLTRSSAHTLRSIAAQNRREDTRPHLRAAIADHRWLVERTTGRPKLWRRLGADLSLLARAEHQAGNHQPELFDQALVAYEQARRIAPGERDTHLGIALVHIYRAQTIWARGGDPRADWTAALEAIERAEQAAPHSRETALLRLRTWRDRGSWLRSKRADTPEMWAQATAVADAALAVAPDSADTRARRAGFAMRWADCLRRLGGDPEPKFREAAADYTRALKHRPDHHVWLGNRASARLQIAFYTRRNGNDDAPLLALALSDADAALRIREDADVAHAVKVDVLERLGRLEEALTATEAALRHHPRDPVLQETRTRLRAKLGK